MPEAAAKLKKDRAQRIAGVHGGVEDTGGSPTLRSCFIVGGKQAPDRLLRRRPERRSAGHAADGIDQAGDGFLVP